MENNEEQDNVEQGNIVEKTAERAVDVADAAKEFLLMIANFEAGNWLEAIKNVGNLLKNKEFRKILIMHFIRYALLIIGPIIAVLCFFGVLNSIKEAMISFYMNATNTIAEVWKWLTDDYWIKIDEEIETDPETGAKYTIVDKYIRDLGARGVSLRALRLLGDADYSDEENLLKDEANKKLVEKYIAEFIRADIITQQPHRRDGTDLVSSINQNHIDGGVYLYRTKKEPSIDDYEFENGVINEPEIDITDKDYKQMTFLNIEEFKKKVDADNPDARYYFSIDEDTDELLLAQIKTTVEVKDENWNGGWFENLKSKISEYTGRVYDVEMIRIPYKQYISKYSMPYEFLINLCLITQNPEFVYHVALLARDTKIVLAIQDKTTIERETIEVISKEERYVNANKELEGATLDSTKENRKRTIKMTTVETPILTVDYADTWSFYEEFTYTKKVEGTITESNPTTINIPISGDLKNQVPARDSITTADGIVIPGHPGYYWDIFEVSKTTNTQSVKIQTEYNPPIVKSLEKSKQFLGLLRNHNGECHSDCFQASAWQIQKPLALECTQNAEFDKQGINVQYRIPNMTRTEPPLNKLTSGIDMLYAVLQSNSTGYSEEDKLLSEDEKGQTYKEIDRYIADEDYESAYVVKMQGLVEHLQYLMTFPETETYEISQGTLDNLLGDTDYIENIIPGTNFWWPLDENRDYVITSKFGKRKAPKPGASTYHKGVDIAGAGVHGVAIIASADGVVTTSAYQANGYGNYVIINHGNGFETRYAHNNANIVSKGDTVTRGQVIGYVGTTGVSTGSHLHFEVRVNGQPQDPLKYVSMTNKRPE